MARTKRGTMLGLACAMVFACMRLAADPWVDLREALTKIERNRRAIADVSGVARVEETAMGTRFDGTVEFQYLNGDWNYTTRGRQVDASGTLDKGPYHSNRVERHVGGSRLLYLKDTNLASVNSSVAAKDSVERLAPFDGIYTVALESKPLDWHLAEAFRHRDKIDISTADLGDGVRQFILRSASPCGTEGYLLQEVTLDMANGGLILRYHNMTERVPGIVGSSTTEVEFKDGNGGILAKVPSVSRKFHRVKTPATDGFVDQVVRVSTYEKYDCNTGLDAKGMQLTLPKGVRLQQSLIGLTGATTKDGVTMEDILAGKGIKLDRPAKNADSDFPPLT